MTNKATQEFINQHIKSNVKELAFKKHSSDIDLQYALTQISAFQIISKKVPSWQVFSNLIFPKHLSLEQASSEYTAKLKAEIIEKRLDINNFKMVDLTGGLGIDCFFISRNASEAHYVEINSDLATIAKNNFIVLNRDINIHNVSSKEFLINNNSHFHLIYIDPARRAESGKKLVSISDCSPNILEIEDLLWKTTDMVMVKLSPMLDISLAIKELNHISELFVISHNNECKELVFILRKGYKDAPKISAININSKGEYSQIVSATREEENSCIPIIAQEIKEYLYEPYASILKAGLYKTVSMTYNIEKLHVSSHLYTSSTLLPEFPGRKFKIIKTVIFNNSNIKSISKDIPKANITTRNFPLSVDELRKKTKIKEGGNIYIFATTISTDKILIICESCA